MPVLCIGPVCIPLNLLLPFLLGLAHRGGWLRWVKREWLTLSHWRAKWAGAAKQSEPQPCGQPDADSGPQYICEGDVCRLVPPGEAGGGCGSRAPADAAAASPGSHALRQRAAAGSTAGLRATDL